MQAILVVDDQAEIRTALEALLTRLGYRVVTASNGQEAAAVLGKLKFDLVITDVLMPGKDGIEVVMDLRKTQPTVPVIVMTGGGHLPASYYLKLAQDMGAASVLQKPFANEQLLQLINSALAPVIE